MSKTYRAEFFTSADWAHHDIAAATPAEALEKARRFYDDNLADLDFRSYDAIEPLDRVQIWDGERGILAEWESAGYRLQLAAGALRDALAAETEAAQAVIDHWERGDLAGAVRALAATLGEARAALAKAQGDHL